MKEQYIETHGKIEGEPTTLDQVWGGFNEFSKYGTIKEPEYQSQLDEMNRTDLERHARNLGVIIVESSARLKDKLVLEFRRYVSQLRRPVEDGPPSKPDINDEVKKILAEGR
jgi:hypothetical protein